jgi:hypothetical protein
MDKCKQIFALLSDYVSSDITAGDCEEIERHMGGCPPCLQFLESVRQTVGLCRELEPGRRPPPLDSATLGKLRECYQQSIAARANRR